MQDLIKRENLERIVFLVAMAIAIGLIFKFMPRKGDQIMINCSISEISPDFTTEMREACRQVRAEKNKENLQKPK